MTTSETDAEAGIQSSQPTTEVVWGLDENLAGALCYALGIVTGLVFYFMEEDNEFVRFHATQSIVVFGALFGLTIGLSILSGVLASIVGALASVLSLVQLALNLASLAAWLLLMFKAYQGERFHLPVAGDLAEQYQ